jgi:hypothetical protein
MLLPYTTLTYYGPGAAAIVVTDAVGTLTSATPAGLARVAVTGQGLGFSPFFRPSRMKGSGLVTAGQGLLQSATPRGSSRAGLRVQIGTLSQDDVTGAVLESEVEDGLTVRQTLRLMAAALFGRKVSGGAGVQFRNGVADTKTRITSNADRTVVDTDLT